MAWVAREKNAHRSVAIPGRVAAKIDATPGAARAAPRRRSYRSVGENRWRFHRSALRPRRAARWCSLRARAATGAPLRAGTGFQARDSAKTETAIWRQKHSRFAFPRRVMALDRSLCAHFADIRATPDLPSIAGLRCRAIRNGCFKTKSSAKCGEVQDDHHQTE